MREKFKSNIFNVNEMRKFNLNTVLVDVCNRRLTSAQNFQLVQKRI